LCVQYCFFFSSRRRHTRFSRDWSSDVCSSDLSRVMLLIAAGGISIVSNWIRVYSLILIGHYTRMQHYLIVEEHYYYGWAIFTVRSEERRVGKGCRTRG